MRLWTILPTDAWEVLNQQGCLRATERNAYRDYLQSYHWMGWQMVERLGMTGMASHMPIWAWYQYRDDASKRPDLRSTGHLPTGSQGYRVEFDVDEDQVLLSDFNTWHHVLNYFYLPGSEQDHAAFLEKYGGYADARYSWDDRPSLRVIDEAIQESWTRIFDLDWHDPWINLPRPEKQIQACIEELDLEQVVNADRFVAR